MTNHIDKRFQSDVLIGYVLQGATVVCGFGFMALVTYAAGLQTYGSMMLLVSLSSVVGNVIGFRTNEALVAFYKRGEASGDDSVVRRSIQLGLIIDCAIGLCLLALITSAKSIIAVQLLKDPQQASAVAAFAVVMLITSLRSTPAGFLQATERISWLNALPLIEQLVRIVTLGAFAAIGAVITLHHIVTCMIVAGGAALAVTCVHLLPAYLKLLRAADRERKLPLLVEGYLAFSTNTFVSSALKAGNQQADTLLLGYLTNPQVSGVYSTLRQFLAPVTMLPRPFEAIAYPRFVTSVAKRTRTEISETISAVNRKLLPAATVLAGACVVIGMTYAHYMRLNFGAREIIAFAAIAAATILRNQLWWARSLANAVDTSLSVKENFAATLFLLITLPLTIVSMGIVGVSVTMLALAMVLTCFWRAQLKHHAT